MTRKPVLRILSSVLAVSMIAAVPLEMAVADDRHDRGRGNHDRGSNDLDHGRHHRNDHHRNDHGRDDRRREAERRQAAERHREHERRQAERRREHERREAAERRREHERREAAERRREAERRHAYTRGRRDERDRYIENYYRRHAHDDRYREWHANRARWRDDDYQRWYRDRHDDNDNSGTAAAAIFGLAAGAILGGAIASQSAPATAAPQGYSGTYVYGSQEWLQYCSSRYRSFDPRSGTYLGYDGQRHTCQ